MPDSRKSNKTDGTTSVLCVDWQGWPAGESSTICGLRCDIDPYGIGP